jgi:hypothetical protein
MMTTTSKTITVIITPPPKCYILVDTNFLRIRGFYSGSYEQYHLLGCDAVQSVVISQKIILFITTAVKTSNPTKFPLVPDFSDTLYYQIQTEYIASYYISTVIIIIISNFKLILSDSFILTVLHKRTYLCTLYQLYRGHIPCIFR